MDLFDPQKGILPGTISSIQSRLQSNGNEGVLRTPQISRTGATSSATLEWEWKSRFGSQIGLRSERPINAGSHILTWNQQLINSFTQNGNNNGAITSTINTSKFREWRPASRKSRREQFVISWLRIGHTRLTHSFILKQEPEPQCLIFQTTCTVKHILIECRTFAVIRKRFFKVNSLTDLLKHVKIDDILSFLRETELYQKIWQLKTG